jgi:hypothetical protein
MRMSDDNCADQGVLGSSELVELGSASKKTRGLPVFLGLFDGGLNWPNIFTWQS